MSERTISDHRAIEEIALLLDRTEWDAGTIEIVAEIIRMTGRTIGPPETS